MANERRKVGDIRKAAQEHLDARLKSLELSKQEFESLQNITQVERQRYETIIDSQKERLQLEALRNEYAKDYNQLTTQQKKAIEKDIKNHQVKIGTLDNELNILENQTRELKKHHSLYNKISGSLKELNSFIGGSTLWTFLMESDKGIKKTALQLGLSGERADILRFNIEQSAQYAARMGVSVSELAETQATYAEETGRALLLNEGSLKAIVNIGKATRLGTQDATRLAAQFELIGLNAINSAEKVEGIVDQSERMGVSATKMLKKVSENFDAINKFAFRDGVDSFAKMAMYAERFKVDMGSMLDSAQRARTLEGAVELAAELQVMGGEFARTDPFELLFLSRNDPEKYQKKINNMTKGIANFRKTADGTFEAYISPMDLDRLERAGAALGLTREEMGKQAKQMLKMQKISADLMGTGLSKDDREMIAGMAEFNAKSGEYFVNLKGASVSISKIGKEHLKSLKEQNSDLKDRALASQTFDEAWSNTINEFKATLLPLVQGINNILMDIRPTVTKVMNWWGDLTDSSREWLIGAGKVAGILLIASKLISGSIAKFNNLKNIGSVISGQGGNVAKSGGLGGSVIGKGGSAAKSGAGMGMLRGGAGAGAAALGIGAGVGAAALGISQLAKSLKELDPKQLEVLQGLTTTLGVIMGIGVAAAFGIAALGASSTAAAPGLFAFGGAVALVGAGIGIAAAGIGYMGMGISELATDDKVKNLYGVAGGLSAIMATTASGGIANIFSGGLVNLAALTSGVAVMANAGPAMKNIEGAFSSIAAVMNGDPTSLDKIKSTIQSIASTDVSSNSAISQLTKLLSQPLTVKFSDDKVAINVAATLELDGETLYKKVISKYSNVTNEKRAREGKTQTITNI